MSLSRSRILWWSQITTRSPDWSLHQQDKSGGVEWNSSTCPSFITTTELPWSKAFISAAPVQLIICQQTRLWFNWAAAGVNECSCVGVEQVNPANEQWCSANLPRIKQRSNCRMRTWGSSFSFLAKFQVTGVFGFYAEKLSRLLINALSWDKPCEGICWITTMQHSKMLQWHIRKHKECQEMMARFLLQWNYGSHQCYGQMCCDRPIISEGCV